jgi:hypothetical protein
VKQGPLPLTHEFLAGMLGVPRFPSASARMLQSAPA